MPSANLNENLEETVALYPNPAIDFLKIDGDSYSTYAIVDVAGKTVKSSNIENQIIDLSGVNPGIYTIQLMNGNSVKIARFMKQ